MFSPAYHEPVFGVWNQGIAVLPPSEVWIREAEQTAKDCRWMRWMQADCESTYIQSVEYNVSKIEQQLVLLAEIADYPFGFCCALEGRAKSDPLFIHWLQ